MELLRCTVLKSRRIIIFHSENSSVRSVKFWSVFPMREPNLRRVIIQNHYNKKQS